MATFLTRCLIRLGMLLFVLTVCLGGRAYAQAPCPDTGSAGSFPAKCTKEIRILNNTSGPIYVVLQGSLENQAALNCDNGGDVWLQAALGNSSNCYVVKHNYHVYINPTTGIPKGQVASISVPWWSKRTSGADDLYVDWWRAARVFIFDDKQALNDSYALEAKNPQVQFAAGSPVVSCNQDAKIGKFCLPSELQIYQVTEEIGTQTPYQLNEYTFADVSAVVKDPQTDKYSGGKVIGLNQGYNVSNVDQVYLPLAIEPVRDPPNIGYMGTTISVTAFRKNLAAFAGTDAKGTNPTNWPIYNNPAAKNGALTYPKAGIRVPSMETVLNFYSTPYYFGGSLAPQKIPQIVPAAPPTLLKSVLTQWATCTKSGATNCAISGKVNWTPFYQSINQAFLASYATYLGNVAQNVCTSPAYLKQQAGSDPPVPANPYIFLRYIYGYVPFNAGCPAALLPSLDLPTVNSGSRVPVAYQQLEYNYSIPPTLPMTKWFNPYTQFIHGPVEEGGLGANAYAFSIDDHSSYLNNDGGNLPGGLIFAIGGSTNLPNTTQVPLPVPAANYNFGFGLSLGPAAPGGAAWAKYGVCSDVANVAFPLSDAAPPAIGVDPAITNFPCTITLQDTKNRNYQVTVKRAGTPPALIWPNFVSTPQKPVDTTVVSCAPTIENVVAPAQWCAFINETGQPTSAGPPAVPPVYSLSARGPLP